jgi:type IV pilus assembly protein PilN
MIRINLLPGPRARGAPKQWDVKLEAAGAIGLVLLTVVACAYYSGSLDDEIKAREDEKIAKDKELKNLEQKAAQVQTFEQNKKALEDKNRAIEQLEKSRAGPVHVMDHISRSLEPLKLWVVRLSVKGNDVELEGRAMSNDDVVEFVNNLRRTDYFSSIRLAETRSGTEAKVNIYQFKMNMVMKG